MGTSSAEHAGKGKEGKGRANTDFVVKIKVQRDISHTHTLENGCKNIFVCMTEVKSTHC